LISYLKFKYNYVDRPFKLPGYITTGAVLCTGRIYLLLVQYYELTGYIYYWCSTMYWQDIFTTGAVLCTGRIYLLLVQYYELTGYIYYWCSTIYWQDIFTTGAVL